MQKFKFAIHQKVVVTKVHYYTVKAEDHDTALEQMKDEYDNLTLDKDLGFVKTAQLEGEGYTHDITPDELDDESTLVLYEVEDDGVICIKYNGKEDFVDDKTDESEEADNNDGIGGLITPRTY